MRRKKDQVTAFHEAGHAVAAWLLDVPVRQTTIEADHESRGYVLNSRMQRRTREQLGVGADRYNPSRIQAEKRVIVSMAGETAQRRFNSRSVRSYHSSSDRETICDILVRFAAVPPQGDAIDIRAHYRLLRQWADELIASNWNLVEVVAQALIERRTLSGKEVRDVIISAARATNVQRGQYAKQQASR